MVRRNLQYTKLSRSHEENVHTPKFETVAKRLALSSDFLEELSKDTINHLFGKAMALNRTKLLVLEPQYGLGNRLRAIASSMAFANETCRLLVLLWRKDEHMGAAFRDLIVGYPKFMLSIPDFSPRKPLHKCLSGFKVYDFMETDGNGVRKKHKLEDADYQHIYVRTAFMLKSPLAQKPSMWAKKLIPLPSIKNASTLDRDPEHVISVHVRGLTLEEETFVNPLLAYPPSSRHFLEKWRGITGNSSGFVAEMSRLLRKDRQLHFFVLSDKQMIIQQMKNTFLDRVFALETCCTSRDVACIRCAFVGILLASKTRGFLGSYGSSFSESIVLLGKKRHRFVRLAGVDF